jgi:hypothetical protein
MLKHLQKFVVVGTLGFAAGCGTRAVVIDPRADVVRLGPGVRGPVYVFVDGQWTLTRKITLPEGWFAGPGPQPETKP